MSFHVRATRHFHWLAERTNALLSERARGIECVQENSGRIVGQIAYDQWTDNSCTGTIAVDTPMAWRRMLRPIFEYPFQQANRGVLLAGVAGNNTKSLCMMDRLGFRTACRIRDGVSIGVDMVFFEMRREECRWLGNP